MTDFLYPMSLKFALANSLSIDSVLCVLDLSKMRMSTLRVALVTLEPASCLPPTIAISMKNQNSLDTF